MVHNNIGLCKDRCFISQTLSLLLSIFILIFFILALPHIVCAQPLPPSPQQPTNISKSPTELFVPILVALITGFFTVLTAYLSGVFIKRGDFDKLFESNLKGALTSGDFLNIIHQMGGFLKKERLEESLKNLIMTKPELARNILNSLIVSFLEEKSIDQIKSYVDSKPSKTMTMAPGERNKFIINTFQQLTKLMEEEKD